jgi:dynactin complex subunit
MPALKNPRHEAFAQAIFGGIVNAKGGAHSQAEAYRRAGYNVTNGNSARACASRLLMFANGIGERIKELQAIAADQAVESAEKMARELNEIQHEARADKAHAAAVSAVLGKAKVLNRTVDKHEIVESSNMPKNSDDIAIELLADVGLSDPDDEAKRRALAAYDAMIATLEAIRDDELGLSPGGHYSYPLSKHEH